MRQIFYKEELLDMRVTEFGLGYKFDRYFLRFPGQTKFRKFVDPLEPAITLREFFERNSIYLSNSKQYFKCDADGNGFSVQSKAYQRFKEFLIQNGFTGDDWVMLCVHNRQTNLFPFSKTEKKNFLSRNFLSLNFIKPKTAVFKMFMEAFPDKSCHDIKVIDVMSISQSVVNSITGMKHSWRYDYSQIQAFRVFIKKIQEKFSKVGINQKDGPFMVISFKEITPFEKLSPYMKKKLALQQGVAA